MLTDILFGVFSGKICLISRGLGADGGSFCLRPTAAHMPWLSITTILFKRN